MDEVFANHQIEAVMYFAAYAYVGESVKLKAQAANIPLTELQNSTFFPAYRSFP